MACGSLLGARHRQVRLRRAVLGAEAAASEVAEDVQGVWRRWAFPRSG